MSFRIRKILSRPLRGPRASSQPGVIVSGLPRSGVVRKK